MRTKYQHHRMPPKNCGSKARFKKNPHFYLFFLLQPEGSVLLSSPQLWAVCSPPIPSFFRASSEPAGHRQPPPVIVPAGHRQPPPSPYRLVTASRPRLRTSWPQPATPVTDRLATASLSHQTLMY